MKISATITDEEFLKIEPYINCSQWTNPIEDEFIFYDPTEDFLVMLHLYSITYWKE